MQDDSILIKKILSGERRAERDLYEKYKRRWFRLCLRYGNSRHEAEDILQDGLSYVFKDLHQFNAERGAFLYWSNRVIINAALRYLKKNQWQKSFADLGEMREEPGKSDFIIEKISAKELTAVIQKLPLGYRVVFNLYVIEGFTHPEIAAQLDISVGTSKSQLSKAKRYLRKQLAVLFKI